MAEDRYVLEKKLGKGGMGEVWLAKDTLLNRPVAVKFLQTTDNPMYKDLFLSEARTLASLQHPNITLIYDAVFDEAESRFYIMMEYVEGKTLAELLQETSGPLPLETIFNITAGILQALDYAHQKGVVHRDIKPENIVIQDSQIKLTDFGLATLMSILTPEENQYIFGTPAYMSPEHILGEGIDGRADLYSVGVTLFEMLTGGERPFKQKDRRKLLAAQIEEEPPSVRQFAPTVPLVLEQVITKLLAKHPDDRYESAGALLDVFNAFRARYKFSQRYVHLINLDASPPVGRAGELKKIEAIWAKTQQAGAPHLLVVRGEMGIGKSRLIGEFLGNHVVDKGLVAAVGRCDEVGAPYTPFVEILAAVFDRGLVKQATLEKQIDRILEQMPGLASLLNIEQPARPKTEKPRAQSSGLWKTLGDRVPSSVSDDSSQSQWQFFSTVSAILAELGPAVVFLDEAAFLDESSVALINFLVKQGQTPLLFIAECRDEGSPIPWLEKFSADEAEVITLLPLPRPAIKEVLAGLMDGPVSEAVVNIVEKRGRGNPFQIEEITRQMMELGHFFRSEEGEWRYKPPSEAPDLSQELISPHLSHAFTRRLEKLAQENREALAIAALIEPGPEFEADIWLALLDESQKTVAQAALDEAVQHRLLRATGSNRYVFRPADIATALAATLDPAKQNTLHRRVAELLIEKQGDPIIIGHHYEQAGLATESARYLEAAGARAMAANAINQAIDCYSRAVELVETQSAYEALGKLYRQQGSWEASVRAFDRALNLARQAENSKDQARIQNDLSFTLWLSDKYQEASQFASAVLKLPDVSKIEQATAQSHLGMISWVLGHLREAEGWCRKSVDTLIGSGNQARLAAAYNRLGLVYLTRGKLTEARQVTRQALDIREKLGDDWGRAYCLVNFGKIALEQGDFPQATQHLAQAQEIFEKIGSSDGLMVVHTEQGRAMLRLGQADKALPLLGQAMQLAQEIGKSSAYGLGDIYLLIAQARLAQGEIAQAKTAAESALRLVESAGNRGYIAAGRAVLAQIFAAQGQPDTAEKMYNEALTLFEQVGSPAGLLRTRLEYAHFLAGQGQHERAESLEQETRSQAARQKIHL